MNYLKETASLLILSEEADWITGEILQMNCFKQRILTNNETSHNFIHTAIVCPITHFFVCFKESCVFIKKLGETKFAFL